MPWAARVRVPCRSWTMREAVAYVATRNLEQSAEVCARMAFWAEVAGEVLQHEPCQDGHAASLWEATCLLYDALIDGRLSANGIAHGELVSRTIPKSAWAGLSIGLGDGFSTSTALTPGWRYHVPAAWSEVRISGDDVRGLWPDKVAGLSPSTAASETAACSVDDPKPQQLQSGAAQELERRPGRPSQSDIRLIALDQILRVNPQALKLSDKKLAKLIQAELLKPELRRIEGGVGCSASTAGRLRPLFEKRKKLSRHANLAF